LDSGENESAAPGILPASDAGALKLTEGPFPGLALSFDPGFMALHAWSGKLVQCDEQKVARAQSLIIIRVFNRRLLT
jgi:hypothetical protein